MNKEQCIFGHFILSDIMKVIFFLLVFFSVKGYSQEILDTQNLNCFKTTPHLSMVQNLNFGKIIPYSQGGNITVSNENVVSKTGDIVLQGSTLPACFDLFMDCGKTVLISYLKKITLNGNHGGTLSLKLNDPDCNIKSSFVTHSNPTRITLGGTLTIGSSSKTPVGEYRGIIQINYTLIHQ